MIVISDYFTKWTQAHALKDQTAQTVADVIVREFVSIFGMPRQIHSDQGRNFESLLFQEMCKLLGANKTRTCPYRPNSDGQVERFNRTLQQMLKTLVSEARDDWDDLLPYVTMAYRSTPHESTGCTPNILMLGKEINLPIDLMVGYPPNQESHYECSTEYVEWLHRTIKKVHDLAREQLKGAARRQKTNYDRGYKPVKFEKGEYVWRYYPPSAKKKLGKGWVGPYKVLGCPSDIHCEIALSPSSPVVRVHTDQVKHHYGPPPEAWLEVESSQEDTSESSEDEPDTEGSDSASSNRDGIFWESERQIDSSSSISEEAEEYEDTGKTKASLSRRSKRIRRAPNKLDL